jgi:hypothetical protein
LTSHHETLAAFDRALTGGPLPTGITALDPSEAEQRFNVYRNNVMVSLTEALNARYPVIRRLVGDAFFGAMARVFIEHHKPTSPVLQEWGKEFAIFLDRFSPLKEYPYLGDVARIEYARGVAFHAADAEPIAASTLTSANPETLRMGLHPSVQVLKLRYAAVSIWTRNQPGFETHPIGHSGEIALVLRDRIFDVPVAAISPAEAEMIEALRMGRPLASAAASGSLKDPMFNPQPLLVSLMQAGVLTEGSPQT